MADPDLTPDTSTTLATLSDAERTSWRLTGELPTDTADPSPTPTPESSPAEPVAQAVSTDTQLSPASEPGTPTTRQPNNADSRKAELKAEIEGLLIERARLREEVEATRSARTAPVPQTPAQAAPSPATSATPFPSYDQWIAADETRLQSLDPYVEYLDARAEAKATIVFEAKQREARAQDAARSQQQQRDARVAASKARFDATASADPAFYTTLDPRLTGATPLELLPANVTPTAIHVIAQELMLSDHGPALMAFLSSHPSEFDRLLQAQTMDQIVRGMGKLEASVSSVAPTAKVVSSAPPPPTTVGSRSGPTDEAEAAGARGDFRAYARAMNAREIGASASGAKR